MDEKLKQRFKNDFVSKTMVAYNGHSAFSGAAAGLEQTITTLSDIIAGVLDQKFYELLDQTPSDFVPFDVGRGAYATNIFRYKAAYVGDKFKNGLVSPSTGLGGNAKSSIVIDGITVYNNFWRMDYEVSNEMLQQGLKTPEAFSIIEENEKARYKIYQLGIQELLFKGLGDGKSYGLLNQPDVTVNTSLFPKKLTEMTFAQLQELTTQVKQTFFANSGSTVLPNIWCMPTNEFLGLDYFPSDYTLKTVRQILMEALPGVKFVHSVYNDKASTDGAHGRHVFYRYDADSVSIIIPKPYTPHPLYPMNGVDSISVAEAQFTGVNLWRTKEMMYADVQA